MRVLFVTMLVLLGCSSAEAVVTYYTTSTARGATGTACTQANRCTNTRALSLSSAGDIVSMEGNTSTNPYIYQGVNDMLAAGGEGGGLRAGLGGNANAKITVRCEVAGGCLLDGQFARIPVHLVGTNNYWIFEDFNVKNGTNSLVKIFGSNVTVRRVVGWDINFVVGNGGAQFACFGGTDNLFEDVAGFGIGTWIFSHSQDKTGGCTFRRAFGRFEGTSNSNNGGSAFGGLFYKAKSSTCDNCIGEYFPNIGLTSYPINGNPTSGCPGNVCTDGAPPIPSGPINQNRWIDMPDQANIVVPPQTASCAADQTQCNMDGYVAGSFFYVKAGTNMARMTIGSPDSSGALMNAPAGRAGGQMTFKDVLFFVDPSHLNTRGLNLFERLISTDMFLTRVSTVAGQDDVIDSVDSSTPTSVGGAGSSGVWVSTNFVHATTLSTLTAANANPWTGTTGANLCHRYENRVRTTTPLWPWLMNQRIIDATNSAGAYTGPCTGCVGTFPARTVVNVTTTVENILGTIPAACRWDTAPTFPDAAGFSPASLSTF